MPRETGQFEGRPCGGKPRQDFEPHAAAWGSSLFCPAAQPSGCTPDARPRTINPPVEEPVSAAPVIQVASVKKLTSPCPQKEGRPCGGEPQGLHLEGLHEVLGHLEVCISRLRTTVSCFCILHLLCQIPIHAKSIT